MEIERKYLITKIPPDLPIQKTRSIEQGYLCTSLWCASAGTMTTIS